jgi:hypothetical protein
VQKVKFLPNIWFGEVKYFTSPELWKTAGHAGKTG